LRREIAAGDVLTYGSIPTGYYTQAPLPHDSRRNPLTLPAPDALSVPAERDSHYTADGYSGKGAAQRALLIQLSNAGARLKYHGDFDWPGVRIANHVMYAFGAQPWRLDAVDYESALPSTPRQKYALTGAPVPAAWSVALARTMQTHGVAIPEEALAPSLLQDLQRQ
jgi:Protein of unknown function C-terminus (DUF2399)